MNATSRAREQLAKLSPQARETHRVMLIVADLLIEQNEHLERLTQAVMRNTTTNIRNAGAHQDAGVPSIPAPDDDPAPEPADATADAPDDQEAENVRLMEPDVPPADDAGDDQGAGRPPAPAKKVAAKKATAKKAAAGRPAAGRE